MTVQEHLPPIPVAKVYDIAIVLEFASVKCRIWDLMTLLLGSC